MGFIVPDDLQTALNPEHLQSGYKRAQSERSELRLVCAVQLSKFSVIASGSNRAFDGC